MGAWARAGIPLRFLECRIWTWPSGYRYPNILHDFTPSQDSLMLTGPVGTGKTGLAVGYAWECMEKLGMRNLRFVEVPQMLAELRDTYNHPRHEETPTEGQVVGKYAGAGLLILDDLGAEQVKGTGWVEDRLYQIIGERHAEQRPTIFTSNLSLDQLADKIGERITSRIEEMTLGRIISLAGMPYLR